MRSYADELLKCQRYFYDSLNSDSADEGYIMGHMWGTGGNAASVYGTVTFPVQMRREPDLVTTSVVGGFRNYCENSAAYLAPASSPGYVSAQQAGTKHFVIGVHNWNTQPDGTGSAKYWTPGFGSWLEKYDDEQKVQFDAEL